MEIRPITKSDKAGKRLFVEISKGIREGKNGMPGLKQGDELLIVPKYILDKQRIEKTILGKYVRYACYEPDDDDVSMFTVEGIVERKSAKWEDDADEPLKEYVLIDYSEDPEGFVQDTFNAGETFWNLEVLPDKQRLFDRTDCTSPRCRKRKIKIPRAHRYCPHCGKPNKGYNKEEK